MPLSGGKCYIGQTGRCINDRLWEHRTAVQALAAGGHLADHCRRCRCVPHCVPIYEKTVTLCCFKDQASRELFEAWCIMKAGEKCVSTASISSSKKEIDYLDANLPRA